MLHNGIGVINVRFAAYCRCSTDLRVADVDTEDGVSSA